MILCCMVPYGTIRKYIYIYMGSMVPYGTVHKYIYIHGTVRYYAEKYNTSMHGNTVYIR